jgi:hypothetical protein
MNEHLKNILDLLGVSSAIAIFVNAIPVTAGILTVIWAWYRIKEIRLAIQVRKAELKNLQGEVTLATSGSYDWKLNRSQVITAALRKLAVLPSGGTASTAQLSDGADALNAILKAFHADGMPLWVMTSTTFTVTSGTASYTIGIGSTVNTVAPLKVVQALRTTTGNPAVPLNIYNQYDFNLQPNANSSGIPVNLYYQPLAATGTIRLWPTPNDSTTTITMYYQRPFQDMDAAADDLDFPNYWTQAIIYNLAWALAPEFGTPPTDRSILMKEAQYWKSEALNYGTEEGAIFLQPNTQGM